MKRFIQGGIISEENMNKRDDNHLSDVHYQVISEIFNIFMKNIREDSFIISLDDHLPNEIITLDANHLFRLIRKDIIICMCKSLLFLLLLNSLTFRYQ